MLTRLIEPIFFVVHLLSAVCDSGRHKPREYPKYMKPERQAERAMDCTICGITLNSATTYKAHIEGQKHLKKVLQEKKKKEELQRQQNKQVTSSKSYVLYGYVNIQFALSL